MGCNESKTVKVQPVGSVELKGSRLRKTESEADPIECDIDDTTKKHKKRSKSSKSLKSRDGSRTPDSDRGGSAGSKKSNDSGLGDLGEYNHGFITEHSDPNKVKSVEDSFQEREDLGETICVFMCLSVRVYACVSISLCHCTRLSVCVFVCVYPFCLFF